MVRAVPRPSATACLLAVLALGLAVVPAGQAQELPAAPVVLLEDKGADVALVTAGTPTSMPAGTVDEMDLLGLDAVESAQEFLFTLRLKTLESTMDDGFASGYEVLFRHHDQQYRINVWPGSGLLGGGGSYYGYLEAVEPGETYGAVIESLPVTADIAGAALGITVRRDLLTDSEGAPPFPGRALQDFTATAGYLSTSGSIYIGGGMPAPHIADRMPDEGMGQVPMPVVLGVTQSGHLALSSDEPFRASNGEAATFVFRVNATSSSPEDDLVEFVATGVPAAWDVRVPGLVRLEANQTVEFPIIVHTAFAHAHGTATAFTLELVSQTDPSSVGRVQMGLRYPRIAQPAGHHNEIHLHNIDQSAAPGAQAFGLVNKGISGNDFLRFPYMNTAPAEEDGQDSQTATPAQFCGMGASGEDPATTTFCWFIPLMPTLEMGLDFDLTQLGTYTIPIHSLAPQPGARVTGRIVYYEPLEESSDPLYYYYEREAIPVAVLNESERVEMSVDGRHEFEGIITPLPEGDLLRYRRGAGLELQLEFLTARPDNFFLGPKGEPELLPGGTMTLPLLEYEDPVDEVFGDAALLHLGLDGDSERYANPGDTVVYDLSLHNADNDTHDLAVAIIGGNRGWARLVGSDSFRLGEDESHGIRIAVTVPADALHEDRADLVIEVASEDDIAARALVRLVTVVDTEGDHEDQASLLEEASAKKKDTPAPAAPLALMALALVVAALRRR